MKLDEARVEQTLNQFEAQAIPEDHPAVAELKQLFGDHTYFLDASGLSIVEPADPADDGAELGKVVKLASWADDDRTSLKRHAPQQTDLVVVLETAA